MANADQVNSDGCIVLLEEVIKTNKDLLEQNKAQQEELKARSNQHGQALRQLNANIEQLKSNVTEKPTRTTRKRKRTSVKVPSICRKYDLHKRRSRKNGRKREKLTRRTIDLEKVIDWDVNKRGKAAEILIPDCMSSEESDYDDSGKTIGYTVKRLALESPKVKKLKKKIGAANCYIATLLP
ncbi:uncharacterized protein LOC110243269 [Exaiptasia diaphana]|uniref:Uncharacterized protein n=1 Tax=Exaiptasia diaphana TaxID=2652724 RepID=A0A913YM42_EXADI|nr:uncharacterized protein LOC110243269 [Exaiptasia diaphana]